jgi:DNA helicase-2/ATP-dependent DNA helicase PcrA
MSSSTREELEEERRLFYVALTRAENRLISYAVSRFQWGKITDSEPSRFLSEVDSNISNLLIRCWKQDL